jgi:hypothetical protein
MITHHDMILDRLHDIGEETFRFDNHADLPHFVGYKTDQMCREDDFLDQWRVVQTSLRNLQFLDQTLHYIVFQSFCVFEQANNIIRSPLLSRGRGGPF